jgi:hypothetical protein
MPARLVNVCCCTCILCCVVLRSVTWCHPLQGHRCAVVFLNCSSCHHSRKHSHTTRLLTSLLALFCCVTLLVHQGHCRVVDTPELQQLLALLEVYGPVLEPEGVDELLVQVRLQLLVHLWCSTWTCSCVQWRCTGVCWSLRVWTSCWCRCGWKNGCMRYAWCVHT